MNIAIIGLGKMGQSIAYRLVNAGHTVYGFDINTDFEFKKAIAHMGVVLVPSLESFKEYAIDFFWLFVAQGPIIDQILSQLTVICKPEAIIIDGGNSKFTDSMRRAQELKKQHISFLDCGTSGGVHAREHGFCLMIGGEKQAYDTVATALCDVAMNGGCAYIGISGMGHYVKMVHNGIEYGLLQAYAEGFDLLKNGEFKNEQINLEAVAHLWNNGSIIRSWILTLIEDIMKQDQDFNDISGQINATGMGAWTVEKAELSGIEVPVIKKALEVRYESEKTGGTYATKLVAMLRKQFGGHAVVNKK